MLNTATEAMPKTRASRQQLDALLTGLVGFAPAYELAMANHLPMALHAAWELGADEARLRLQIEQDLPRLEVAPAVERSECAADWREHLGRRSSYTWLRLSFDRAMHAQGSEALMRDLLPVLLQGLATHALHGLIRAAHACESGCAAELSAALAAWASEWACLPAATAGAAVLLWPEWRQQVLARLPDWRSARSFIQFRMTEASTQALYLELADALAPAADLALRRGQWLALALDLYLATRNFTVLHMITGLRALRVLRPFVADEAGVQVQLSRALLAALMAAGLPDAQASPQPAKQRLPDWVALHAAALSQTDAHVLKLVHACWQEDDIAPDPRWREVAAMSLA